MSILLNDNLNISSAKPADSRYGPYNTVAEALAAVPSFQRYRGLVVAIVGVTLKEYWFKAGILDTDLEEKPTEGLDGAVGFTGSQGVVGFTGSQGIVGFVGSQGIKGDIGYTGSQGDIGYTGSQGIKGDIGYTGSQGNIGDVGYTGSQGNIGDVGYTGSAGVDGAVGFTGSQGTKGDVGFTGSKGTQGDLGYTGSQGDKGDVGYTGSAGVDGVIGRDGYTGSAGNKGDVGYTGSAGIDGAVGFTGSAGLDGAVGFTGSAGLDGAVGFTGSQGNKGDVGYTGSAGVDGAVGFTGSQGDIGYTGSSGLLTVGPGLVYDSAIDDLQLGPEVVKFDASGNIVLPAGKGITFDGDLIKQTIAGALYPIKQTSAAPRFFTNNDFNNGVYWYNYGPDDGSFPPVATVSSESALPLVYTGAAYDAYLTTDTNTLYLWAPLSTTDMKPGDFYYDEANATIFICYEYTDPGTGSAAYNLLDLTPK